MRNNYGIKSEDYSAGNPTSSAIGELGGEYAATEDDTVIPGKTYCMLSGGTYTSVSSPVSSSLSSYYELVGADTPINFMV